MKHYGIIGYPLDFTLSPGMHNAAFHALRIEAEYAAYPVLSAVEGVKIIRDQLQGASITIPHKISMAGLLDELDATAGRIGAVNTVVMDGGRLKGFNTDWTGVVKALEERIHLKGRKVLLAGAGGGARAAAWGVRNRGARLWIMNRNEEKGRAVARDFEGRFLEKGHSQGLVFDVIINATPVFPDYLKGVLNRGCVVMDMAYGRKKTGFSDEAAQIGCFPVNGLRMLLHQGAEQFRVWTGANPPLESMERALYEGVKNR